MLSTNAVGTDHININQEEASVQDKRRWLQDALSSEFGLVRDLIPRAFKNAAHEGVGDGSCWINSVLQSLFGCRAVQHHLQVLFRCLRNEGIIGLSTPNDYLWQVGSQPTVAMLRLLWAPDDDISKDAKLAITFMASMSSTHPADYFGNGDAFLPGLALRTWYESASGLCQVCNWIG